MIDLIYLRTYRDLYTTQNGTTKATKEETVIEHLRDEVYEKNKRKGRDRKRK